MAADMIEEIIDIVESKGLSFEQCSRQGCDSASTMSGAWWGSEVYS